MMRGVGLLSMVMLTSAAASQPAVVTAVPVMTATTPTQQGGANRAISISGADEPFFVGTAELAGLEIYDASGARIGSVPAGEAVSLDIRYEALPVAGKNATIVAAADAESSSLRFYRPMDRSLTEITAVPVPLGFAVEGVCLYHSTQDGSLYAFAVGDGGEVDQYLLYEATAGRVGARKVRRLNVPSPTEHCVADDRSGHVYVSEETVGIWRFTAEPETDVAPTLIDAVRLGRVTEIAWTRPRECTHSIYLRNHRGRIYSSAGLLLSALPRPSRNIRMRPESSWAYMGPGEKGSPRF